MPYTITAKANVPNSGLLTLSVPTRREALADARLLRAQDLEVRVTDPDGYFLLIEEDDELVAASRPKEPVPHRNRFS